MLFRSAPLPEESIPSLEAVLEEEAPLPEKSIPSLEAVLEEEAPLSEAPAPAPQTVPEEKSSETMDLEAIVEKDDPKTLAPVESDISAEDLESLEMPSETTAPVEPAGMEMLTTVTAAAVGTAAIDALAEKAAEEAARPENDAQIIAEETQEEADPQEESDMLPATGAYSFDGTQSASFKSSDVMDSIVLTNIAHAFDKLSEWYLLVSEFSITHLKEQNGAEIPLSEDAFYQGVFWNADGSQRYFTNETLLTVPADQTNLVLCGIKTMSLAGQENSTIDLSDANGMLIGPNAVQLTFSHVKKLTIPDISAQPAGNPVPDTPVVHDLSPAAKKSRNVFVYSADGSSSETDQEQILIKIGYSLYGWNVAFDNGQTMSLADVRTYQTKHDALPSAGGKISYGKSELKFKNARKISVYEKPSYCGYGKKPE